MSYSESNIKVYIGVVSHGHCELIQSLGVLQELSINYNVVLKLNLEEREHAGIIGSNGISVIDRDYGRGFGENNNIIYCYCKEKLMMKDHDIFIVLNPDVVINSDDIEKLIKSYIEYNFKIATINLYRDTNFHNYDNSIRNFPNLSTFILSFMGKKSEYVINKDNITIPINVDWCAGSFMAFNVKHYHDLNGFDEGYFMYCEDIDICYRSQSLGDKVLYIPQIEAVHFAEHSNNKIFSKHFYWHISSILRFLLSKRNKIKLKSCVNNRMY